MKRSCATFAVAVLLATGTALCGAGTAQAAEGPHGQAPEPNPTERAAAEVRPAIVRIVGTYSGFVVDGTGQVLHGGKPFEGGFTCTGFGVNPDGYVATAGHCVDPATSGAIGNDLLGAAVQEVVAADPTLVPDDVAKAALATWTVRGAAPGSSMDMKLSVVTGSTEAGEHPQEHPAQVVDFRPLLQGDVALLRTDVVDLPTVQLAPAADVRIGTPLLSIGFPASADATTDPTLEPSNKDGRISSKKTVGGVPFYETSAALSPGMSGGPTVDLDGNVLGLNSWGPTTETQAINFIAPADGLAELMTKNGVPDRPGPHDVLFRSALDAYYAGHYTDAIASLDTLLVAAPGHPQATELRADAFDARERYGDVAVPAPAAVLPFGLAPLLFWSIAGGSGVVLLVVVVAIVALVRRRRRRRATAEAYLPPLPMTPPSAWLPVGPTGPTPWAPVPATQRAATALLAPPMSCPRCVTPLPDPTAAFCSTCGLPQRR